VNYGIIRGIAQLWIDHAWTFRVLVLESGNANWRYLYIPASNYRFRQDDIVSWGDSLFKWHTHAGTIQFNLLQTGVAIL
jgi:hypothetical protein